MNQQWYRVLESIWKGWITSSVTTFYVPIRPSCNMVGAQTQQAPQVDPSAIVRSAGRHWMWVTSRPNWQVCVVRGLFGFDDRYRSTVSSFVRPSDVACVYVTGHEGTRLIGFVGIVTGTGVTLDCKDSVGWMRPKRRAPPTPELYPHRVTWRWLVQASIPVRIDPRSGSRLKELEYFTDKSRSWYSFVYPSIARLPAADVMTILTWMTPKVPA